MITCNDCGKTVGEGDIGEHWICDSCKIPEPKDEPKSGKPAGNETKRH